MSRSGNLSHTAAPKATSTRPSEVPIGVVGLGLMGTSISTCLLAAGHPVAACDRDPARRRAVKRRVRAFLSEMQREGLVKADPNRMIERLNVSEDFSILKHSAVIIESITESLKAKIATIRKVEEVVDPHAVVGSNTSAIPVSQLQTEAEHPERILGIHWAEPAHITRFMEIICGDRTDPQYGEYIRAVAQHWGKEPSLLRKDIRGFITNRCFYALLREAFFLVESGYATVADVDRSLRNDLGYWITMAGPFRFMDLTGVPAYATVMRDLFPELRCDNTVPTTIDRIVKAGGRGISNGKGFYHYTPAEARLWEQRFTQFTYEIRAIAQKYPDNIGVQPRIRRKT